MENVCRKLGFNKYTMVEARGKAGGLVLMWSKEVNLEVEWKSNRFF